MVVSLYSVQSSQVSAKRVGEKKDLKKTGSSSFSTTSLDDTVEAENTRATKGAFALSTVDALFLSMDRGSGNHDELVSRGNLILDQLETLRTNLLIGNIPPSSLSKLQELITQQKESCSDPALLELMEEINIRAAVELAKLGL